MTFRDLCCPPQKGDFQSDDERMPSHGECGEVKRIKSVGEQERTRGSEGEEEEEEEEE